MADYIVVRTQPTVYLDKSGSAVSGYLIQVEFPEFDEVLDVKVASLDPKIVGKAIETLLDNRRKLAALGG
jgi:hypothetical protein